MPRRRKNESPKERVNFSLSPEAVRLLQAINDEKDIPMSRIVERALWFWASQNARSIVAKLSGEIGRTLGTIPAEERQISTEMMLNTIRLLREGGDGLAQSLREQGIDETLIEAITDGTLEQYLQSSERPLIMGHPLAKQKNPQET